MKTLVRIMGAPLLLALWTSPASAQGSGKNDSVDYIPRTYTIAGTLPVGQHYALEVSAPTQLNTKGQAALENGVVATLRAKATSYPEGSSEAEAEALVSLDDLSMVFYALGETHQTTVHLTASNSTTPGDYVYHIQAVGPPGLGWGISNHTLIVTVNQPVVLDITPPDVRITSPTDTQAFTFCFGGTKVPVTISAVDAESVVTAIGGSVNRTPFGVQPFTSANTVVATGEVTAFEVGTHTLGAWATSAGGTGTAPEIGVSVNYVMSWLPPINLGRTLAGAVPIKFAAHDCFGGFVADTSVRVEVWEGSALRFTAVYGDGSDAVRIENDSHYIANFKPATGSHTYTAKVYFNDSQQATTAFTVK